ncbi:MAG: hypothetical protein ACRDTE_05960 [Pseudonocardiaceae bacterium]
MECAGKLVAGDARFRTGAYRFWRAHLRVLLRAADVPDTDDALAEMLLAPLGGELYRYLRGRGLSRAQLVTTLIELANRTLGGNPAQQAV